MNYQLIYNQIIERAQKRQLDGYTEKHHIIPKCLGGSNNKNNLVSLTAREHFLCHQLLCEIYPDNHSIKIAFWAMCNFRNKYQNNRYIPSSKTYELAKIQHSLSIKEKLTGIPKPKGHGEKISKANKGKPKPDGFNVGINRKGQGKGRNITWDCKLNTPERKSKISKSLQSLTEKQKQERSRKISEALKHRYSI